MVSLVASHRLYLVVLSIVTACGLWGLSRDPARSEFALPKTKSKRLMRDGFRARNIRRADVKPTAIAPLKVQNHDDSTPRALAADQLVLAIPAIRSSRIS